MPVNALDEFIKTSRKKNSLCRGPKEAYWQLINISAALGADTRIYLATMLRRTASQKDLSKIRIKYQSLLSIDTVDYKQRIIAKGELCLVQTYERRNSIVSFRNMHTDFDLTLPSFIATRCR